jgi:hypothetical protein
LIDIVSIRPAAMAAAQQYIGTSEALTELGWGVSGIVFASPLLKTAIKVHHRPESFQTELRAYEFLKRIRLTTLHGLTIPRLRGHDERRQLIEIDLVRPPYLLDFAGVRFEDPQFSADTLADIHETIRLRFGNRASVAYAVYDSLRKLGMYYLDLRPGNLNFRGLPATESDDHDLDTSD